MLVITTKLNCPSVLIDSTLFDDFFMTSLLTERRYVDTLTPKGISGHDENWLGEVITEIVRLALKFIYKHWGASLS